MPNLLLLHFNDLKEDLPGQIRRIAAFLGIGIDERQFPAIVEHCGFAWMKTHAAQAAPLGGVVWEGGAETFINRGTNGRWRDELPIELSRRYEALAERELGAACARWLATGYR